MREMKRAAQTSKAAEGKWRAVRGAGNRMSESDS